MNSHLEEITSIHVTDELLMPQDLKKIAQLRHYYLENTILIIIEGAPVLKKLASAHLHPSLLTLDEFLR